MIPLSDSPPFPFLSVRGIQGDGGFYEGAAPLQTTRSNYNSPKTRLHKTLTRVTLSPDYFGAKGLSGGGKAKILRHPDFVGIPQNDIKAKPAKGRLAVL